jgi:hypothetical protein
MQNEEDDGLSKRASAVRKAIRGEKEEKRKENSLGLGVELIVSSQAQASELHADSVEALSASGHDDSLISDLLEPRRRVPSDRRRSSGGRVLLLLVSGDGLEAGRRSRRLLLLRSGGLLRLLDGSGSLLGLSLLLLLFVRRLLRLGLLLLSGGRLLGGSGGAVRGWEVPGAVRVLRGRGDGLVLGRGSLVVDGSRSVERGSGFGLGSWRWLGGRLGSGFGGGEDRRGSRSRLGLLLRSSEVG